MCSTRKKFDSLAGSGSYALTFVVVVFFCYFFITLNFSPNVYVFMGLVKSWHRINSIFFFHFNSFLLDSLVALPVELSGIISIHFIHSHVCVQANAKKYSSSWAGGQ